MKDTQILQLFFSRDEEAVREVSDKYGAYCRSIGGRMLAREADVEECLNDTWLRAWNSIPPNRPRELKLYLGRITRNLALNRRAAEQAAKRSAGMTEALEELAECIPGGETAESAVEAEELRRTINRFLEKLPERDRSVFLRRYFYVETAEEIARRCGLTVSNVNTILSRVRKKLKNYLTEEEFL